MKKLFIMILALLLVCGTLLALMACDSGNVNRRDDEDENDDENEENDEKGDRNQTVAYKIEYYYENATKTGYDAPQTVNKTGVSGKRATVDPEDKAGFTLNTTSSVLSGTIAGDGSLVLKVYYDRIEIVTEVAEGICGSALTWVLTSDGTLTISGSGAMSNYSGKTPWEAYQSQITSVVIPDSVTRIGDYAFYSCSNLTSIEIPDSVTSIGEGAFRGCSGLTSVVIPDSVTFISERVFACCTGLMNVVIPDSVGSIGDSAFSDCYSLTGIIIPDSVVSIGDYAFSSCDSLTSIVIPDSVVNIGHMAFYNCYKLVEVISYSSLGIVAGGENFGYVGKYAKAVHRGESKIVDQDGWLFYTHGGTNYLLGYKGADTAIELILPDNYNGENYEIYKYAFYRCTSLTSVEIGNSVTSIGDHAFRYCTSLTSVEIGDSVTSIGSSAFYSCSSLTSVEIGDSVESIGEWAFSYCTSLTSVEIGNSVESIGKAAFSSCYSLTSVEIGDSVTSMGAQAFYNCYKLVEVINHSSLNIVAGIDGLYYNGEVGEYAMEVHSGKSKIVDQDGWLFYTYGGVNYLLGYKGANTVTELILPDNYKGENYEIYDFAFYDCDSLTKVMIPNSVTGIGYNAFCSCNSLASAEFKNPNGWWYSGSSTSTSGYSISSNYFADKSTAAQYLRDNWCDYYLKRG